MRKSVRYVWALPATALGLSAVPLAWTSGGRVDLIRGVLEIHGGLVSAILQRGLLWRPAAALTLGHVILGLDEQSLDACRDHEHVHVRQYERWGPLFLPAYLAASLVLWLRGRDPYYDNPFEVEAYGISECPPAR